MNCLNTSFHPSNYLIDLFLPVFKGEKDIVESYLDVSFEADERPKAFFEVVDDFGVCKSHPIKATFRRSSTEDLSSFVLTLHDTSTSYLELCDYEFAEIIFYRENFVELSTFISSDLGGKNGLSLVTEVLKTLRISHCYLNDQALLMTHRCCKEGLLNSLKLAEVFKKGYGWYQGQGAHLPFLIQDMDFEAFKIFAGNKVGFGLLNQKTFGTKINEKNYLAVLNEALNSNNYNYLKSCSFLHKLTFEELKEAFKPYAKDEVFKEFNQLLEDVQTVAGLPQGATIGRGLKKLVELGALDPSSELHFLKHRFMNQVIDWNSTLFHHFLTHKLKEYTSINAPFQYSFYLVLSAIFCYTRFLMLKNGTNSSLQNDHPLSKAFLLPQDGFEIYLREEISPAQAQYGENLIEGWNEALDQLKEEYQSGFCAGVKYFHENDETNLIKWGQFLFGEGLLPFYSTVMQEFKNIKICDLQLFAPNFAVDMNAFLQEDVFESHSSKTLLESLKPFEGDLEKYEQVLVAVLEHLFYHFKSLNLDFVFQDEKKKDEAFFLALAKVQGFQPLELDLT